MKVTLKVALPLITLLALALLFTFVRGQVDRVSTVNVAPPPR